MEPKWNLNGPLQEPEMETSEELSNANLKGNFHR